MVWSIGVEKSPHPRSAELTAEAPLEKGVNEGIIPCALRLLSPVSCLLTPCFI
jgi:hypothetical protein